MWSNSVKTAFFKELRKIAQRLGASPPDPHSLRRLETPPPDPRQWYVWIAVHYFTQHVSQFRHFHILIVGLNPHLWTSSSYVPRPGHGFWSSILRYLCPHKNSFFKVSDDVIACDLWFVPPPHPNQKSWLRLWAGWIIFSAQSPGTSGISLHLYLAKCSCRRKKVSLPEIRCIFLPKVDKK